MLQMETEYSNTGLRMIMMVYGVHATVHHIKYPSARGNKRLLIAKLMPHANTIDGMTPTVLKTISSLEIQLPQTSSS
jgi:hypothetical protein